MNIMLPSTFEMPHRLYFTKSQKAYFGCSESIPLMFTKWRT